MTPRVLFAILSARRPALKDRATARHLPSLLATGHPVEWVVREDEAADYEDTPGAPLNTYTVPWADRWAQAHWRHPRFTFTPGGFHGAHTGREWAMQSAEQRGFDAVIQLDDNILAVGPVNANWTGPWDGVDTGRMALLTADLCMSTTAVTVGFQLAAVAPSPTSPLIRPGYPYSLFACRCGPARMPWCGPFEEDIMQTLDLATRGGPHRTSAVLPTLTYYKDYRVGGGMRTAYTAERGLGIAQRYPANVKLRVSSKTAGPKDTARGVRHYLTTKGFQPVLVTDRPAFDAALQEVQRLTVDSWAYITAGYRRKMQRRAGSLASAPPGRGDETAPPPGA